jgi:multiple sugar transport system substrate-binding protein
MREKWSESGFSRREILKGAVVSAGVVATSGLVATELAMNSAKAAGKSVSYGSYLFDPSVRMSEKSIVAAASKAGFDLTIDAIDHLNLQSQINSYLQGTPDDVLDFNAGYRLQYAVSKGLITDVSDLWSKIRKNYARSDQTASTAPDKKQYFVPVTKYPWAVMYRKSIFKAAGIDPATVVTWSDFINTCNVFKSKGLTPIALGDSNGWEAMGTFSFVNLRTNGFKFHSDLLAGRVAWSDDRVQKTFRNWETMLPYQNSNALDLDWASAGRLVLQMKAAMQVMSSYHAQLYSDPNDLADLAMFPFPEIGKAYKRDSIVAPVNGYVIPRLGGKNIANAKSLVTWFSSVEYADAFASAAPSTLFANGSFLAPDNQLVRQQVALVNASKYTVQSLERVTRPDFVNSVVAPAFQSFLKNPGDKKKIGANMAALWRALPND